MDGDFQNKLSQILSNPEALQKIGQIASGMGTPSSEGESTTPILPELPKADPRIDALRAIKPLLREDKRSKIDSLARALSLAAMLSNIKKPEN